MATKFAFRVHFFFEEHPEELQEEKSSKHFSPMSDLQPHKSMIREGFSQEFKQNCFWKKQEVISWVNPGTRSSCRLFSCLITKLKMSRCSEVFERGIMKMMKKVNFWGLFSSRLRSLPGSGCSSWIKNLYKASYPRFLIYIFIQCDLVRGLE